MLRKDVSLKVNDAEALGLRARVLDLRKLSAQDTQIVINLELPYGVANCHFFHWFRWGRGGKDFQLAASATAGREHKVPIVCANTKNFWGFFTRSIEFLHNFLARPIQDRLSLPLAKKEGLRGDEVAISKDAHIRNRIGDGKPPGKPAPQCNP